MPAGYYAQRIGEGRRTQKWKYNGWNRGQNSYAEDNEIRDNEFFSGINIEIQGRASIRMPRRGDDIFTTVIGGTTFNGWGVFKNPKTGLNILVVQHTGRVYKISTSGVVSEIDNTKTWDTDAIMRGIQLREFFYFGNGVNYMAKTDGTTITRWNTITTPSLVSLTTVGTGSDTLYAYSITAVTANGETDSPAELSLMGNGTLDTTNYNALVWNRKTDSEVVGYNIWKAVNGGTLRLLTFIDQQSSGTTMTYNDKGVEQTSLIYEIPSFNTTGGIQGNLFAKYANTLFLSGNVDEPDTVFYGGTGADWESFSPSSNGGWVKPGRGDGEIVTAMLGFEDFLFIFKDSSIWKFTFSSDGAPSLVAVIPQYGTSSPDSVQRFEKDIIYLGSDGRMRILGYEPNQLNVIRTADISNRIQPDLDVLPKTNMTNFHGVFFEQKYILCNKTNAYPYDRRYIGFLGTWTNYAFDRFIIWDRGTGQQHLFGASVDSGELHELLVDNTYSDNGTTINSQFRVKRQDGGDDGVLKCFLETKTKLKNPRGNLSFITYKDGSVLLDTVSVSFDVGGGIDEFMFDEGMFDDGASIEDVSDASQLLLKDLETLEAYSIYHQINVAGNDLNHCIVQTMSGRFEVEDDDYRRDERVI
jgi:hypothetical protein